MKKTLFTVLVLVALFPGGLVSQSIKTNVKGPMGLMVNTFSGNLYFARKDFYMHCRRIDMDFSFSYNSWQYQVNSGFGNGWIFKYSIQYATTDSTVSITWGDGRVDVYTLIAGVLTPPIGTYNTLNQYQPNEYVLTTPLGVQYYFNNATNRKITSVQAADGNGLNFSYTDSLLTSVTSTAGQIVKLQYAAGNLTSISCSMVSPTQTYTYAYDNFGNLLQVTDPKGNSNSYTYLPNGPMATVKDKNGNVADVVYNPQLGVEELITCDSHKSFSYDAATFTTYVTDYLSNGANEVSTYLYDGEGDLVGKSGGGCCGANVNLAWDPGNLVSFTDGNGNTYKFLYDNSGNKLQETDPMSNSAYWKYYPNTGFLQQYTDFMGNIWSYVVNAGSGLIMEIDGPTGYGQNQKFKVTYSYYPNGDLETITDANGNTTTCTYDTYGNLQTVKTPLNATYAYTYDLFGNMLTATDPNLNTTTYTYDVLNLLTTVTDVLGNSTIITYDANGNKQTVRDGNGNPTTFKYDASNHLVQRTNALMQSKYYMYDAMGNLQLFTDEDGNSARYTYNSQNQLISTSNVAAGETTNFTPDGNGNIIRVSYPNGNVVQQNFDVLNRLVSASDNMGTIVMNQTYDKNGNLKSVEDANQNTTRYAYDALNRCYQTTDAMGNSSMVWTDANGNVIKIKDRSSYISTMGYDALNRDTGTTDAMGNITKYAYDPYGNMTYVEDAEGNYTNYTWGPVNRLLKIQFQDGSYDQILSYDKAGNILKTQNANGITATSTFDVANRVSEKDYSDGTYDKFTYYPNGNLWTAVNNNASETFVYTGANRLLGGTLNSATTSYTYNTATGTKTTQYPDGTVITDNYDLRDRLSSVNEGIAGIANYSYDAGGRCKAISYLNGTSTAFAYNNNNQIQSMLSNPGNFLNFLYQYDNIGDPISEQKLHNPGSSEAFTYDKIYRLSGYYSGVLVGPNIPSPTDQQQYVYDSIGNRHSVTDNGLPTIYTANSANSYTDIEGTNSVNPVNNPQGNLAFDGVNTYTYDAKNELVSVNNGSIATYKYDALGRRISKIVGGNTTQYYYSDNRLIEESTSGSQPLDYIYGPSANFVIARQQAGTALYYHYDALGSVVALTNSSGAVVERYEYDPFGNPSIFDGQYNQLSASTFGNDLYFTGQLYDPEIGNYNYRKRAYNPKTGRFLQRDPVGYSLGDMNLYTYCQNRPGSFIDPTGTGPGINNCDWHSTTLPLTCPTYAGAAIDPDLVVDIEDFPTDVMEIGGLDDNANIYEFPANPPPTPVPAPGRTVDPNAIEEPPQDAIGIDPVTQSSAFGKFINNVWDKINPTNGNTGLYVSGGFNTEDVLGIQGALYFVGGGDSLCVYPNIGLGAGTPGGGMSVGVVANDLINGGPKLASSLPGLGYGGSVGVNLPSGVGILAGLNGSIDLAVGAQNWSAQANKHPILSGIASSETYGLSSALGVLFSGFEKPSSYQVGAAVGGPGVQAGVGIGYTFSSPLLCIHRKGKQPSCPVK